MKQRHALLFIGLGVFLSTAFLLLSDWYTVKIEKIYLPDSVAWALWFLLAAPLIFYGISRLTDKKSQALVYTLLGLVLLAGLDIALLLYFHFWIGGSK